MENKKCFEAGKSYSFFVPPGWIIVGCVSEQTEDALFLDHAFHLESVADGVSSLSLSDVKKQVTKSYPLPSGVRLDLRGILISAPCESDITPLSLAHTVAAIKGKK